jgi:pyrroline-5-carboxylate reductase
VAKDLVLQTARGAGLLATEADKNGEGPAELRRKVTSPGGTTEAALKVFKEGKMDELVSAAITRARDRARELAK